MNALFAALLLAAFGPLPPTAPPEAVSPAPATSPLTSPARGGTSFDDAVVINAANESDGAKAEYTYLAAHPCGNGGKWRLNAQHLITHDSTPYDVLDVTCSDGGANRSFYFDIKSFFGKM